MSFQQRKMIKSEGYHTQCRRHASPTTADRCCERPPVSYRCRFLSVNTARREFLHRKITPYPSLLFTVYVCISAVCLRRALRLGLPLPSLSPARLTLSTSARARG